MPPPAPLAGGEEFYSPCVSTGLWGFLGRARSVIQNHTQEEPSSASCSQSAAVPLSHLKGLCAGALIAQTGKVSCDCLREANFSHFTPYFSLERCWSQHSASSQSGRFVPPAAPKGAARARTGMLLLVRGSRAPQRRKAWISAGRVIPAACKYQQHTGVGHLQPRASGSLAGSNSVSQARCLCALVTTPAA